MTIINTIIPFASSLVSFIFAFLILRRFFRRGGLHHLLWGIGMLFYGIGGFCEGYYGALGWNPCVFRLWYLFGALLRGCLAGTGHGVYAGKAALGERPDDPAGHRLDLRRAARLWR